MLWKALFCSPLLTSVALGAPAAEGQSLEAFNQTDIVARGGNHQANLYSAEECTGDDIDYVYNFGCGGTCHTGYNQRILSNCGIRWNFQGGALRLYHPSGGRFAKLLSLLGLLTGLMGYEMTFVYLVIAPVFCRMFSISLENLAY
ncbi:hypothetical protein GE09DRAFT_1136972 [Coniochaeta sp. 2T2.1]|nr:hypothetical protein GE09DRAFT_1136972 [Coniochaeta sp. 2T2.1]